MKVRELIKLLEKLDEDLDVVISSDEEGNSYRLLYGIELGEYWHEDAYFSTYDEEEEPYTEDNATAIAFW